MQKNASNLVVKIDFKVHVCVKSYLEKKRNEITCMHASVAFSIPMQFRYGACRGEKGEAVVTWGELHTLLLVATHARGAVASLFSATC